MRLASVPAWPVSLPVPENERVSLGIGTAVKRDAVVVKVVTDDGLIGWGESHHGRAHGAIAHLINTTLRALIQGMDAADYVAQAPPDGHTVVLAIMAMHAVQPVLPGVRMPFDVDRGRHSSPKSRTSTTARSRALGRRSAPSPPTARAGPR